MANHYDRIFKENIEVLLLPLLRKVLGLNPAQLQPIDAKLQVTQEMEMDHIRRVAHADPALDYGLQIEFHIADEDLRKRNLLHYAMFHSITGLPLRQIVIYGGRSDPRHIIRNHLLAAGLELRFEVVVLKQLSKDLFIGSAVPEEVLLAILCDFGSAPPEQVVRQILARLQQICRSPNRIKKYQKQLLILSRLRKMEITVKNEVEAMTIHYDVETDGLFLQGIEQGIEKGIEQGAELKERAIIQKLWSVQEFSLEKIAELTGTDLERVIAVLSAYLQATGQSAEAAAQILAAYRARFV